MAHSALRIEFVTARVKGLRDATSYAVTEATRRLWKLRNVSANVNSSIAVKSLVRRVKRKSKWMSASKKSKITLKRKTDKKMKRNIYTASWDVE